jgi:hypothetical protein
MGMMKWMARKGAVGGTARWAAQGYAAFVNQCPNIIASDLYRSLIKHRYAVMPNPEQESFLLSIADQIRGLRGLVVAILTIEAGFTENTPGNQQMFMEIIDEELLKKGVPINIVSGS